MEEVKTELVEDQSILKKINQRLRDFIFPGTKLTPQEETIMNIVYKILNAAGTVKLTPPDSAYYLINHTYHYFVKVQNSRIYIINSVDSVVRDCPEIFISFVRRAIEESLNRDIEKIDAMIFTNEVKLLEKIESKVNE